jgi:hypothetical protein
MYALLRHLHPVRPVIRRLYDAWECRSWQFMADQRRWDGRWSDYIAPGVRPERRWQLALGQIEYMLRWPFQMLRTRERRRPI